MTIAEYLDAPDFDLVLIGFQLLNQDKTMTIGEKKEMLNMLDRSIAPEDAQHFGYNRMYQIKNGLFRPYPGMYWFFSNDRSNFYIVPR